MKSLNLGILAHVDAGKTSLTERLLFNAGVIKTLGSVDTGNTHTDSLALEQKRGITIKSAVVSFQLDDLKVNLIDTPGHPDFIAEVERALSVLDAVVLVVSAVEGVQPQTRVLMRTLKRMKIPTLIFVNKIDRMGARDIELVQDIRNKLFPNIIPMNSVVDIGSRQVTAVPSDIDMLQQEIARQTQSMDLCPIFFGSAMTGVGLRELADALKTYFVPSARSKDPTLSAVVFKIERNVRGEKVVYVRVFEGVLKARMQIQHGHGEQKMYGKISKLELFARGDCMPMTSAHAGDIAKIQGLDCQVGDVIGQTPTHHRQAVFARPHLEVVIECEDPFQKPKLHTALMQLSEQDPLIQVRQNEVDTTLSLQLYGEVQKEVIQDTLMTEYGLDVTFRPTTTICIERPVGLGEAIEIKTRVSKSYLEWDGHSNPFLATIGLRVEPASEASGAILRIAKEALGRAPSAFYNAIEETMPLTLRQGLYGWQVTDCIVTLTHIEYYPRQSTAHSAFDKNISSTGRDFRHLTPLVLINALKQAATAVYEPLNRFEFEIPAVSLSKVVQRLSEAEARLEETIPGHETTRLIGTLPVRRTFEFEQSIPDITGGDGIFLTESSGYQIVRGAPTCQTKGGQEPAT